MFFKWYPGVIWFFDTTSIRKKSIGQESISKPSVRQVSHLVKYVNWSTSKRNTSFRQPHNELSAQTKPGPNK